MSNFARRIAEQQPLLQRDITISDVISQASVSNDNTDDSHNEELTSKYNALNNKRMERVYWIDSSPLSKYWDLLDVILNLAFCSSYIWLTIQSIGPAQTEHAPPPPSQIWQDIDLCISILLFIQYVPRIYLSMNIFVELQSVFCTSTILSTLSVVWVYFDIDLVKGTFLEGGNIVFLFPLRFIRLHGSISRCFPVGKKGFFKVSSIRQKAVNLALSIFTTLLSVTAWVHICLYKVQKYYDLSFFDIFYTITVSSTSGLSTQIVPDNIFSRFITLGVMIIGAVFLPTQIGDLMNLIRSSSKYTLPYVAVKGRHHVVIVGNLEIISLQGFLREFFSSDHGNRTLLTDVVILSSNEPSDELISLLTDPIYSNRVQYIKGTAMSFKSLRKAKVSNCTAAFVLASPISDVEPVEEDARTVMRCVSLRKYQKKLKIFAQILLPRNKIHLDDIADHVLCIDEFKMGMTAINTLCPGFTTIMYLFTNSITEKTIGCLKNYGDRVWIKEYLQGALMEIYEVRLDHRFAGVRFKDAVIMIYKQHQAVLIGIAGGTCLDGQLDEDIVFNPMELTLQGRERAYLITEESLNAHKIGKFDSSVTGIPQFNSMFWNPLQISEHLNRRKTGSPIYSAYPRQQMTTTAESLESLPFLQSTHSFKLGKEATIKDFTVIPTRKSVLESDASSATPTTIPSFIPTLDYIPGKCLAEKVNNHVVFCSIADQFPVNAMYFLGPFRQCDPTTPVVFLAPNPPDEDTWKNLSKYEHTYYIIGTPLLRKDLRKVRIHTARRTVILSDPFQQSVSDRTADAPALLALLNIQAMCPDGDNFVTVEFVHPQNMKLIGNFNHSIREAWISDVTELQAQNIIPAFVGGHVFSQSMFHSVLCQAYYETNLLDLLKLFMFSGTKKSSNSKLFQIMLPDIFIGLPYGSLFTYLVENHHCTPIGIYRKCFDGKSFQYVILNPSPSNSIQESDSLYLLGTSIPTWDE